MARWKVLDLQGENIIDECIVGGLYKVVVSGPEGAEGIWAECLVKINDKDYLGRLDNHSINTPDISLGDVLVFRVDQVKEKDTK